MARLVACIRGELSDKILPALDDPTLKVNVQMMMAILNQLEQRVEHELAWMREEGAAVSAAAEAMVSALPGATVVAEALAAYQADLSDSLLVSRATEDYQRASALLGAMADAAYASGDAAQIDVVERLVDHRLATERAAIGEFIAVGRD
jgi:hypothetical protein